MSLVEYEKSIQTIENYVGEYVIGVKEKMSKCRNLLENLMQRIQLENLGRGRRIILKPVLKKQD